MRYQDFDLVRLSYVFLAKNEYKNQPYLPYFIKMLRKIIENF